MPYKDPQKQKEYLKQWKEENPEYNKKWEEEHKEERKEYRKNYYQKNKEELDEKSKKWKEKNPEKVKKRDKKYREEHKEEKREYRKKHKKEIKKCTKKWRKENPEKVKKINNKWRTKKKKTDFKFHLNCNISTIISQTLKKKKAGRKWETLVGYTLKNLIIRLEFQFDKNMSWDNYGSYWEIDHKKPKSLFHFISAEEQAFKDCWCLANLQPLEKSENRKKFNHFKGRTS